MVSNDNFEPFTTLGVSRDAPLDEVARKYRQLARQFHPDRNHDPRAVAIFHDIVFAYELIEDSKKMARWEAHKREKQAEEYHRQQWQQWQQQWQQQRGAEKEAARRRQDKEAKENKEAERHRRDYERQVHEEAERVRREKLSREQRSGKKPEAQQYVNTAATNSYATTAGGGDAASGSGSPFRPYGPFPAAYYNMPQQTYRIPQSPAFQATYPPSAANATANATAAATGQSTSRQSSFQEWNPVYLNERPRHHTRNSSSSMRSHMNAYGGGGVPMSPRSDRSGSRDYYDYCRPPMYARQSSSSSAAAPDVIEANSWPQQSRARRILDFYRRRPDLFAGDAGGGGGGGAGGGVASPYQYDSGWGSMYGSYGSHTDYPWPYNTHPTSPAPAPPPPAPPPPTPPPPPPSPSHRAAPSYGPHTLRRPATFDGVCYGSSARSRRPSRNTTYPGRPGDADYHYARRYP